MDAALLKPTNNFTTDFSRGNVRITFTSTNSPDQVLASILNCGRFLAVLNQESVLPMRKGADMYVFPAKRTRRTASQISFLLKDVTRDGPCTTVTFDRVHNFITLRSPFCSRLCGSTSTKSTSEVSLILEPQSAGSFTRVVWHETSMHPAIMTYSQIAGFFLGGVLLLGLSLAMLANHLIAPFGFAYAAILLLFPCCAVSLRRSTLRRFYGANAIYQVMEYLDSNNMAVGVDAVLIGVAANEIPLAVGVGGAMPVAVKEAVGVSGQVDKL